MTDRPIIFTAESVRAVLAGTKTQTRRLIEMREFGPSDTYGYDWTFRDRRSSWNDYSTKQLIESKWCRFSVGTRLWVKEARWASRLTSEVGGFAEVVEIVDVRVQRLQDISDEDATAEGISVTRCGCEVCSMSSAMCPADASACVMEYAAAWDEINSKRAPWASNPWVWAITFKKAP